MPPSSAEHVPTSASPLHQQPASATGVEGAQGHTRQRSLGQRRLAEGPDDPRFVAGQQAPAHSAVYMAGYEHAPSGFGTSSSYPSPRSSINSLPLGTPTASHSALNPFRDSTHSLASTARAKYGLLDDQTLYGVGANAAAYGFEREADDALHDPGPKAQFKREGYSHYIVESGRFRGSGMGWSGFLNIAAVCLLFLGIIMLFAGWPVINWAEETFAYNTSVSYYDDGAITTSAPNITKRTGPIDPDTPASAYTKTGVDGTELDLVFSDEFEEEGRLFYDGMDPYWVAVDLHYWQEDSEWYEPDNVWTEGGSLVLALTKETNASSHGLGYLGGMVQSWNRMCFTGGRIEVKVSLPGTVEKSGYWPAIWTLGNLGRVGYGASLEGMWPYQYDFCDTGTLANQTNADTGLPTFTADEGDQYHYNDFSYLTGQRLSRCTCDGEDHPGPKHSDGTYFGRSGKPLFSPIWYFALLTIPVAQLFPEIDIFEATVNGDGTGNVSQSSQWAPFNPRYDMTHNNSDTYVEYFGSTNGHFSGPNSYKGGVYQQVTSGLSYTNLSTYDQTDPDMMAMYGFEYKPTYLEGFGTGEITWLQEDKKMWRISDSAMSAVEDIDISNRNVTGEPLSIIANFGMSSSFQPIQDGLVLPAYMRIDYVRVYQDPKYKNIGCDPPLFPTNDYIQDHIEAYSNQNLTTWDQYASAHGKTLPMNKLIDTC